MKFSKSLFFVFFLIISYYSMFGQTRDRSFDCGFDEAVKISLQNNLIYEQQTRAFEKKYVKYIESQTHLQENEEVYTLPTVVHIIHAGAALGTNANPTDANVETVLNEATDRFRHRQAGDLNFSNPFSGVDTNIEFCLATTDSAGNYSTGVIRHFEPALSTGPYTQLYDFIAATKWDDSKYCNLYIMTNMTNASGVYLGGSDVTVYTSTGFWSGLIAHEIGHYLNLRHTFQGGCTNGNCLVDGDAVCDTPPKASPGFPGNDCELVINSCTSDVDDTSANNPYSPTAMGDQPDILENYMDYTGSCWDAFTIGQKARMRLTIQEYLLPLTTHASTACAARTKPAHEIGVSAFEVATSACTATAIVKEIVVNNFGSSPVNNFSIEILINGEVIKTVAQTLLIETNGQITLPIEELITLQEGDNLIQVRSKAPNGNIDGYTNNDVSYGNAYFQASPNKAPYEEAFSSTTFPDGFRIKKDSVLAWNLLSSFEAEQPCYGSQFAGAIAYAAKSETANMELPLLDLSNGIDATLSFKYGYVQRYDWIIDTLSVIATTDCGSPQVLWEKFGANLSTGTPSDGVNVFPGCGYDQTISIDLSAFVGAEKASVSFLAKGRFYSWITLDSISVISTTNDCEATNLTIPDAYSGMVNRVAQSAISSTSTITSGGIVNFSAGNSITLNAGFHAQSGSQFSATIKDCELPALQETALPNQEKVGSNITESSASSSVPQLSIYPNPSAKGQELTIQLAGITDPNFEVGIYSTTGQIMEKWTNKSFQNKPIPHFVTSTSTLSKGIYFIIFRNQQQTFSQKVIVLD